MKKRLCRTLPYFFCLATLESSEYTRYLRQEYHIAVKRNYRVKLCMDAVADSCGIWLQGCCEGRYGVGVVLPPSVPQVID